MNKGLERIKSHQEAMVEQRFVLIVESDPAARTQMKSVLAEMGAGEVEADSLDAACDLAEGLARDARAPKLIVVRVTLPDGNAVQVFDRLAVLFPHAHYVLVSHYPKHLLFSVPGFASLRAEFLQAAFTDEEFRKVVGRVLGRTNGV
jgi:CheY-like chemotaxis protein